MSVVVNSRLFVFRLLVVALFLVLLVYIIAA